MKAFEVQARDSRGHWDAENVSGDPYATTFFTQEAAEDMIDELVELDKRDRESLRVREVDSNLFNKD